MRISSAAVAFECPLFTKSNAVLAGKEECL